MGRDEVIKNGAYSKDGLEDSSLGVSQTSQERSRKHDDGSRYPILFSSHRRRKYSANYRHDLSSDESISERRSKRYKQSSESSGSPPNPSSKRRRNKSDSRRHKMSSVLIHPIDNGGSSDIEKEREAALASQRENKQVFERNRRMFGMLVGTLQRFKKEETKREVLNARRSKVEEKLEADAEERSMTEVNRHRDPVPLRVFKGDELLSDQDSVSDDCSKDGSSMKSGESTPDAETLKLDLTQLQADWEQAHLKLCKFIQTETKPRIFWLPKEHNAETEMRLRRSRDYHSLYVAERMAKFKKELNELELPVP